MRAARIDGRQRRKQSLTTKVVVPDIAEECDITDTPTTVESKLTQTDYSSAENVNTTESGTDPVRIPSFSVHKFENNPAGIHCFTGLESYQKFIFVRNSLGQAAYELTYMYGPVSDFISVSNRFFLVLIKLRRHYSNFELSRLFAISEEDVYNLFCTWIRFMSLQWREYPLWVPRDLVRFFSPSGFKQDYPSTRVIIDGTECPVRKPKLPTAQQSTFSTYKNKQE